MLHVSRAAAKAFSVALAAASLATARTGVIDMDGDGYSDIPLATKGAGWDCIPTLLGRDVSMTYSCIHEMRQRIIFQPWEDPNVSSDGTSQIETFFTWGQHAGTAFFPIRNSEISTTSFSWAGGRGWQTIPVMHHPGPLDWFNVDRNLVVSNHGWNGWEPWNGSARKISGMFDGDRNTDILFVDVTGDSIANMAFGDSVAFFRNSEVALPAAMVEDLRRSGAKWFVGDVSGDQIDDIVIVDTLVDMGYVGVAISRGGDDFIYRRADAGLVSRLVGGTILNKYCVFGDFDGDGKKDLAALDQRDARYMQVAYSDGNGFFSAVPIEVGNMNYYASLAGARAVVGDFNGDGVDDLALAGGRQWRSIPVAAGSRQRLFTVTNIEVSGMSDGFGDPSGKLVVGDFNNDQKSDVAVIGARGDNVFVATALGGGSFSHQSYYFPEFQALARNPSAFPVIEVR